MWSAEWDIFDGDVNNSCLCAKKKSSTIKPKPRHSTSAGAFEFRAFSDDSLLEETEVGQYIIGKTHTKYCVPDRNVMKVMIPEPGR
jgi:hypothetical protein